MRRRQLLAAAGATLGASTAGCLGLFETTTRSTGSRAPPLVENRPDAVYVPSHVEGMQTVGTATSGRYRFSLSYSYPHRFWRVTADRTTRVGIREADTLHLMLTAWDAETGTVVPASSPAVTAEKDGEAVLTDKRLWAMLSQNMGVHFGDNVALAGAGTYDVTVDFGPVQTRRAGALAGALADRTSVSFSLPFDQETLQSVSYRRLDDRKGNRGAVDPMSMGKRPAGQLPPVSDLPGRLLGEAKSGDAVFAVTALDAVPDGIEGEGTYLALSARTPYNRYPLPFMSLAATLSRDGGTVFDGEFTATLHPELGSHYGAVVDDVQSGDTLAVSVVAPPQISRHEGYETAFLDMPGVSLTV